MKIQIATAPCSWGVFYADGGTSGVPYEVFLQQAAELAIQTWNWARRDIYLRMWDCCGKSWTNTA